MKHLRNAAVVILVTVLSLSVSAFASGKTEKANPVLHLASADQKADPGHEKATLHEAGGSGESHGSSGDSHGHGHANLGETLPLWSCIPFALMLLSIALCPLLMPEFWHHHFGKISGFWAASLAVPFLIAFRGDAVYEILHIILADYVPFIILLWSLYTVSGGILLRGTRKTADNSSWRAALPHSCAYLSVSMPDGCGCSNTGLNICNRF